MLAAVEPFGVQKRLRDHVRILKGDGGVMLWCSGNYGGDKTGKEALFVEGLHATSRAYENSIKFWSPHYLTDCTIREVIR